MKKSTSIFCVILYSLLFFSCATFDHKNPYPGMETLSYGNNAGYEFKNEASDKLLIIIEGSGWNSVLGYKTPKRWKDVGLSTQLLQSLGDRYTFFIPEKLDRKAGLSYFEDRNDRVLYTYDVLLERYTKTIDSYLSGKKYKSIVLVGVSEGAVLLPAVYQQLANKASVSLIGSGLSMNEGFSILAASKVTPWNWKKMYRTAIDMHQSRPYPDSLEEGFMGMPYRWWGSIVDVRPFDYYRNINIPVLFVHGEKDYRIPVESVKYIEQNLPEKPFVFKYYPDMEHSPSGYREILRFRSDLAEWITMLDP